MKNLIGIDIGGTKCAVIYGSELDGQINILQREAFSTIIGKPYENIDNFIKIITSWQKSGIIVDFGDIYAIGISCGNPIDIKNGIIKSPPNLIGWDDIAIVEKLKNSFGIPTFIQCDANACAIAEHKYGAGKNSQNMVFLTFGTGFGAGIIINEKIYNGSGFMAGEVGHVRISEDGPVGFGKAGSAEGFCSGGGIAQIGKKIALSYLQVGKSVDFCKNIDEIEQINAKNIAISAKKGDFAAKKVYEISGKYLGRTLAILIDLLNPDKIVIGSIYERSHDLMDKFMYEEIEKEAIASSANICEIVPAKLGDQLGDIAALSVAAFKGE